MLISTGGTVIKMPVEDVKRLGRSTQGVIVMRLRDGETVSSLAPGRRRRRRDDADGATAAATLDEATFEEPTERRVERGGHRSSEDEPSEERLVGHPSFQREQRYFRERG